MTRADLFAAIRPFAPNGKFTPDHVKAIDALADSFWLDNLAGMKRTSQTGVDLIKSFEGLSLKAYPDPGSGGEPITIGYGHTGGVKLGTTITDVQAEAFLRDDLRRFEKAVEKAAPKTTQSQFDALVSFAFNVGEGSLAGSTLLKKHNAGDHAGAAQEFHKWVNAAGKKMNGLVRRRAAESALYSK